MLTLSLAYNSINKIYKLHKKFLQNVFVILLRRESLCIHMLCMYV